MDKFKIIFPPEFLEDKLVQFETQEKGYLYNVIIETETNKYNICFYDEVRLAQSKENGHNTNYFFEPNLIVLDSVNKENITSSVLDIMEKGYESLLLPICNE
jgi:hypothetical protein